MPTIVSESNALIPTVPALISSSCQDRVYFTSWSKVGPYATAPVKSAEYHSLPRVRLECDWATYLLGTIFVVYEQLNNGINGTSCYRCVLEGETLPEGELAGRTIPAEYADQVLGLIETVHRTRAQSKKEALQDCRFVKSRGNFLGTSGKDGPCSPHEPGDCHDWDWTIRQLREVVDNVIAKYPNVTDVFVAGGYDGSFDGDSLRDFLSGDVDYVPWASCWEVTVWTRSTGWLFKIRH